MSVLTKRPLRSHSYQDMHVVCVDALRPGSICKALWGVGMTVIVLGVQRDELRTSVSIDAMAR